MIVAAILIAGIAPARAGNAAAGKTKAQLCAACHGLDGVSRMANVPSLAGQTDAFLEWQLVYFRSGARSNALMSPMAANLSDDDIQNLGAYFSALPSPKPAPGKLDPELMAAAVTVIQKYRCGSCHQGNFAGLDQAARLAAQREEYLEKALKDFKSGARRGGGAAGAMPDIAFPMTGPEIEAVSYYLAHHP